MKFLDSHVHMVSRTTDDYQRMAAAGTVAIIEPSFWQGQPRTNAGTFKDYYNTLLGFERFRAQQFGIKHYCTIGLNPKEANNERLADEVMEILPLYICKEGVVGVGEIGFDDQSKAEEKYLRIQAELALEADLPIQIHTPHRDKKKGTSRTMDVLEDVGVPPSKVVIDHNNEETVKEVLDRGYWCAFTIYPHTKLGNERMIEIMREYGAYRHDSVKKQEIDQSLCIMIVKGFLPLSIVEQKGFKDFAAKLDKRYRLPTRHHLTLTLLPNMKTKIEEELKLD
ncbi:MAG: TatD family hydrolase, partial [Verrucomicrobiota bacterium]